MGSDVSLKVLGHLGAEAGPKVILIIVGSWGEIHQHLNGDP